MIKALDKSITHNADEIGKDSIKMKKKKATLFRHDFLSDEQFQLYLSETLIAEYGTTTGIPKKKYFKTLEKCCREWISKLNKPRTTSNL